SRARRPPSIWRPRRMSRASPASISTAARLSLPPILPIIALTSNACGRSARRWWGKKPSRSLVRCEWAGDEGNPDPVTPRGKMIAWREGNHVARDEGKMGGVGRGQPQGIAPTHRMARWVARQRVGRDGEDKGAIHRAPTIY